MNGNPAPSGKKLESSTELAVERTLLAYERTLMAWVRTATSLISFGFAIFKFFQGMRQSGELRGGEHLLGSTNFGLMMICIGLVVLVLATIQHRRNTTRIKAEYGVVAHSLSLVLAALISFLGVVGLLAVIFRQ